MADMNNQYKWEQQLDSVDPHEREEALARLVAHGPDLPKRESALVNMHIHSFFSYNAKGLSPSHIAWEARKAGLAAVGLCDFDVLDGLEEFLRAGRRARIRTAAHLETRAFVEAYKDVDINSPGEPGVAYVMAAGFGRELDNNSAQAKGLAAYRTAASSRNTALVRRINDSIPAMAIDYRRDVTPLTPAGAATERHIARAYIDKARSVFQQAAPLAEFWAGILEKSVEDCAVLLADAPAMEAAVRARLVKQGGVGYRPPSPDAFPSVDTFMNWARTCKAIPMMTWLDGVSEGEKDGRALLACMQSKGAAALNIIPDRNWNVSDPATRALKTANLKAIVEAATDMGFPINIGTEMNNLGLPFADDLDGEVLKAYKNVFLQGAHIMVGHTVLLRYADYSYVGEPANAEFRHVREKNAFFESVGRQPPLDCDQAQELEDAGPDKALAWLREKARRKE